MHTEKEMHRERRSTRSRRRAAIDGWYHHPPPPPPPPPPIAIHWGRCGTQALALGCTKCGAQTLHHKRWRWVASQRAAVRHCITKCGARHHSGLCNTHPMPRNVPQQQWARHTSNHPPNPLLDEVNDSQRHETSRRDETSHSIEYNTSYQLDMSNHPPNRSAHEVKDSRRHETSPTATTSSSSSSQSSSPPPSSSSSSSVFANYREHQSHHSAHFEPTPNPLPPCCCCLSGCRVARSTRCRCK